MNNLEKFLGESVVMVYKGKPVNVKISAIQGDQFKSASGRKYELASASEVHLKEPYCIGKRYNPQLSKPYYRMFGRLTRQEQLKKSSTLYGGMSITAYDSELEYNNAVSELKNQGLSIY